MKYTLIWKQSAEDHLAEIWIESKNRNAVSAATMEIDRQLRNDPETKGESRTENERILIERPLIVTFEVREDDRIVTVLSVHFA